MKGMGLFIYPGTVKFRHKNNLAANQKQNLAPVKVMWISDTLLDHFNL